MNLYDKYSRTGWEQLWADDNAAFVLYREPDGRRRIVTDNGTDVMTYFKPDLSDGLDFWNACINQYLDIRKYELGAKSAARAIEFMRTGTRD